MAWKDIVKVDLFDYDPTFKNKNITPEQKDRFYNDAKNGIKTLNELEKLIKEHDHHFFPEIGLYPFLNTHFPQIKKRLEEIMKDARR